MKNPTAKQQTLARSWLKVVKEFGIIDKWELVDRLNLTVGSYYKYSAYMRHRLEPAGIVYENGYWKFTPPVEQEVKQ